MLFECVPNLSEGRDADRVAAIAAAVGPRAGGSGIAVLDVSSDADHNRTVLTLAGQAAPLLDGLIRLFDAAVAQIDLRRHTGVHPRIGAVDVVPFVPLQDATMHDAVRLAKRLGARVAERLALPVLLYGRAAARAERRELANLRRGGTTALAERLAEDGGGPDFGPRALHPRAGATAVGARDLLIAFNVVLASRDLPVARAVAARVREQGGGLRGVRALGLRLAGRGRVQVSMNLVDLRRSRPIDAFERVAEEADKHGVRVAGSEIVGLVPAAAVGPGEAERMRLGPYRSLESRLVAAGLYPAT